MEDITPTPNSSGEEGFSLVEVAVAMVVILVAVLGVFFTITYAINYNAGNNSRAQCLAVLQQEVERLRSAKFTPGITDAVLAGTSSAGTSRTVTVNNLTFTVTTVVDNDPYTAGIQNESVFTNIKEISITARLRIRAPDGRPPCRRRSSYDA